MTKLDQRDAMRKVGSVGVPLTFMDMKIVDVEGNEAAAGEVGEICGRGPLLMPGYYNRADLTAEAIVDGWLHIGDLGYVDEDGFLYLFDCVKDMIISGGANIYPAEIESELILHEKVTDCTVFGIPNADWGEEIKAVVQPADDRIDFPCLS